jgi:hypothetical protein
MAGSDNELRTKVLVEINEDFHQADKLNIALKTGLLSELVKCFAERDSVIRELASRAVLKVACTHVGRTVLVEHKVVSEIRKLFDDSVV